MLADLGELVVYESNLALHDLTVFSPLWMAGNFQLEIQVEDELKLINSS